MNILLKRDAFAPKFTAGRLYIDGKFECYTLEDCVREITGQPVSAWKIPRETAIPRGTYKVGITLSSRFKKMMMQVFDVPGFEGIRIHAGNTNEDTEGCILLGDARMATYVGISRPAVGRVQAKIQAALDRGETVSITVE